jgi:D-alanyl-D-alanine carboxypeptidase
LSTYPFRLRRVAALAATAGLFAGPVPAAHAGTRPDAVQQNLNALVGPGKYPGALAAVRDRHGRTRHYTAGAGDVRTGAKVPADGRVRIGSASKMFTAVVVLQLVGEGKVGLDVPVETYLPGVVRGNGVDPSSITVRHLLQHTSGLPDYTEAMFTGMADYFPNQHRYFEPRELLDLARTLKAEPAGGAWAYSNTNYVLAGLLAQRVTGRPFNELVTTRVIDRIGLLDTYLPEVGEQGIRGRHPKGYVRDEAADELRDFTEMDPGWGWAAGQMVSTPSDVNTFMRALLGGKLLKPAQLTQMRTTVDVGAGMRYGLGLFATPLSCGGVAWGHGGVIPGYSVHNGATDDGRSVNLALTSTAGSLTDESVAPLPGELVDAALCAT